ncbi:MAG TPA: Rrf2 family transcriptional regulator [Thermoleophilia bacterium]|nr:Rrf2 family transcriptional regulator [Thermoleophilia bacterium]
MVHLSTKSDYAIKALVRLALANGDGPVQAREISAYAGIPPKFLEQVMHDLRQGGLVTSQRGKGGGYAIARDPATISFADVIDLIDGSHGGIGRMRSGDRAETLVEPVWREVRECTRAILRAATIADAAERTNENPMYYI